MNKYLYSLLILLFVVAQYDNAICSSINSPEKIVLDYAIAYQNQKWAEAASCLHPELLASTQDKNIDILKKVKESELKELLLEFGVAKIKDLEILSPEQFFVVNQNRRFKAAKAETELMKLARFGVIKSKQNSDDEVLVELKSTTVFKNTKKEKFMTYYVVKLDNNWKIIKTVHNK